MVQTVLGPIRPDELGPTLMHEHLLCDVTPPGLAAAGGEEVRITLQNVWEINYRWGTLHLGVSRILNRDVAVRELERMREHGGRAVVELTNHGLKRDPQGLRAIAERAGVHVVMGSGHYTEPYLDSALRDRTSAAIADEIVSDIISGVGDTGIRAGIIGEIGCSEPWTDAERRAMQAAVWAQRKTGAAVTVHPGRHRDSPFEVVRFIEREGGDLARTIIGHLDRTITDLPTLLRLATTGCVLEFDLFGIENTLYPFSDMFLPNDGMRLDLIRGLLDAGHIDRVVISHDICTRVRQVEFGGHGYGHIFANVVPLMRRKGFTQAEIDSILVHNPARLLAFA